MRQELSHVCESVWSEVFLRGGAIRVIFEYRVCHPTFRISENR